MADTPIGIVIPSAWNDRVKAMAEKVHNGGKSLTPAATKTLLQNLWRDSLKSDVLSSEADDAAVAKREETAVEMESWT